GGDVRKNTTAKSASLCRNATTLFVGKPGSAAAQELAQNGIFGSEELDHVLLLSIHPPCKQGNEELHRQYDGRPGSTVHGIAHEAGWFSRSNVPLMIRSRRAKRDGGSGAAPSGTSTCVVKGSWRLARI